MNGNAASAARNQRESVSPDPSPARPPARPRLVPRPATVPHLPDRPLSAAGNAIVDVLPSFRLFLPGGVASRSSSIPFRLATATGAGRLATTTAAICLPCTLVVAGAAASSALLAQSG